VIGKDITDKLKELGYEEDAYHLTNNEMMAALSKTYNVKFTEDWPVASTYYIYEETTRDGYSNYIMTESPTRPCISTEVYQYTDQLSEDITLAIVDKTNDKKMVMYVEDTSEQFFLTAIVDAYNATRNRLTNEIKDEIEWQKN